MREDSDRKDGKGREAHPKWSGVKAAVTAISLVGGAGSVAYLGPDGLKSGVDGIGNAMDAVLGKPGTPPANQTPLDGAEQPHPVTILVPLAFKELAQQSQKWESNDALTEHVVNNKAIQDQWCAIMFDDAKGIPLTIRLGDIITNQPQGSPGQPEGSDEKEKKERLRAILGMMQNPGRKADAELLGFGPVTGIKQLPPSYVNIAAMQGGEELWERQRHDASYLGSLPDINAGKPITASLDASWQEEVKPAAERKTTADSVARKR